MLDECLRVILGGGASHAAVEKPRKAVRSLPQNDLGERALARLPGSVHDDDTGVFQRLVDQVRRSPRVKINSCAHRGNSTVSTCWQPSSVVGLPILMWRICRMSGGGSADWLVVDLPMRSTGTYSSSSPASRR